MYKIYLTGCRFSVLVTRWTWST